MAKVLFSSWGHRVVDNRGAKAEEYQEADVKLPPQYDAETRIAAFMGWDGIIVLDASANVVDMARAYMEAAHEASCKKCSSCRVGTMLMARTLNRILEGEGREDDLEKLARLGEAISKSAMCTLGETAPIPVLDTLKYFRETYLDLINNKRSVPKSSYKTKVTAPCTNACPAHVDIPGYVEHIKNHEWRDSLSLIREAICLPGVCGRVCVHPCEEACRRGRLDQPLSVRALKRVVADWELSAGLRPPVGGASDGTGKVAVIGAGPAGLAAAYNLRLMGHPVTIYEALPVSGGMAVVGIPSYRLPRDILYREIDIIRSVGVEIIDNTRLGQDLSLQDLWNLGYQAIFIGVGCHSSTRMGVEGEDQGYEGFIPGVTFLRKLNLGHPIEPKDKIIIVGGGNVAMDCARSALRLGFKEVHLVYRRSRAEMPANQEEIEEAVREGVEFHFLTNPTKILAQEGKVVGVELLRMELGEPDASGRRRPIPIKGSEFAMQTDTLIPAIGQAAELPFLGEESGVALTRWGTIAVNPDSCETTRPGIFAGGDCVLGPATLIEALAAGKEAAYAIDRYLRGLRPQIPDYAKIERVVRHLGAYDPAEDGLTPGGRERHGIKHLPVKAYNAQEDVGLIQGRKRQEVPCLPAGARTHSFEEVEIGFSFEAAVKEAERCLRCYRLALVATTP